MFVMSPNDNRVSDRGGDKNGNFGANRAVKNASVQKTDDYTKPSQERRANLDGDVEEKLIAPDATMDVDDLNDPNALKRETSRRAETENVDHSDRKYREVVTDYTGPIQSDPDKRTAPDTRSDSVGEPNTIKKRGKRNPWRIGEDYDSPVDQNKAVEPR